MRFTPPIHVYCTWAVERGADDPITIARFHGGQYFCDFCGETDHAEYQI